MTHEKNHGEYNRLTGICSDCELCSCQCVCEKSSYPIFKPLTEEQKISISQREEIRTFKEKLELEKNRKELEKRRAKYPEIRKRIAMAALIMKNISNKEGIHEI